MSVDWPFPIDNKQRKVFAIHWRNFADGYPTWIPPLLKEQFIQVIFSGLADEQIDQLLWMQRQRGEQYYEPRPQDGFIFQTPFGEFAMPVITNVGPIATITQPVAPFFSMGPNVPAAEVAVDSRRSLPQMEHLVYGIAAR